MVQDLASLRVTRARALVNQETTGNVGSLLLEEDWRRTVDGILSIEANARLYIDQEREQF